MVEFYVAEPGETAPPVPEGPQLCNGQDMRVVHNAFLWSYERAPGLVRSVAAADTARSELVGRWLTDIDATLHEHHHSEDQLLWDKLEQRAPACALHVSQMRAHHAQVQQLLNEAGPLLARWRGTADPADGERLADAYERMLAVLKVHLRREVVEIIPVVERVLTEREWEGLGEHTMDAIPKSRLMPQFGILLANLEPDDRTRFFSESPAFVRVLYRAVGKRQYAKMHRGLFPGEPVPPTV
ncbi:hemerythrin domain-containing protein [Cellulomonas sp.]|uniref:hemerythrin domain-containing protein n=1 Tax=Cellulomonas sp. TaxID=40001 RepID=UPI003BACF74C